MRTLWRGQGNFFSLTVALTIVCMLSACTVAPITPQRPPHLPERGFTLILPVYDAPGLTYTLTTLAPYVRDEDRFMIVSGNTSGEVDTAWINHAAAELRAAYPYARLYAATSGLTNMARAAAEVSEHVEAVVYIYEPNFPNQPEFSWDFGETQAHFTEAAYLARQGGFRAIGKPTGRPVNQPSLAKHDWDYGALAGTVDEMLIQTQTYCKDSAVEFGAALDAIGAQFQANDPTLFWLPQITIAPNHPNGTTVVQAKACLEAARARGIGGTVLWWSPPYVERTVEFLDDLNAAR